jgi:hypothetical protein
MEKYLAADAERKFEELARKLNYQHDRDLPVDGHAQV